MKDLMDLEKGNHNESRSNDELIANQKIVIICTSFVLFVYFLKIATKMCEQ